QYLTHINYAIWEVIVNGDAPALIASVSGGAKAAIPSKTTEQKISRKNELKAKSTLLLAIPNEHLLKFYGIKDAKTFWEAIKTRFGGNKESKKMQKTILKQQYENVAASRSKVISQEDANLKLLRSLPLAWNTYTLIMRNKSDLDTLSMDELYNNLKLENEDQKQIDTNDLEEIDLKWQVAMLPIRVKRFIKKSGRNLNFNGKETVDFDKTKVECYNCHRRCHFATECRAPRSQGNKNRDITRKVIPVETPTKALVVTDGMGYDWSYQAKEGPTDLALMAFSSSGSSNSDTKNKPSHAKINFVKSDENTRKSVIEQHMYKQAKNLGKRKSVLNNKGKATGQMEVRPIWNNAQRVNHQNFSNNLTHPHPRRNFVPTAVLTNSGKVLINTAKQSSPRAATSTSTARYVNTAAARPTVNGAKPSSNIFHKSHSPVRRTFNQRIATKNSDLKETINTTKRPTGNVIDNISKDGGSYMLKRFNYVDLQGRLNGFSRHMMKNKSILTDYQEIDGRFVAFGGSPKRGRLPRKCKIRTGKLDFEDVYFVKELKFNIFSISQMCDKKNSVLFTKTECLVLSPDFKLLNENQVLLKVPRHNNMYSFDLKNVAPSGDHLGKFEGKVDEGFLVGYSVNSKAFRVFNSRTRKVKENLHIRFLENKSNVASFDDKDADEAPGKQDEGVSKGNGTDNQERSTKKSLCDEFEQMMHKRFQMSFMRELTFFSRLQVKQKDDRIFISQDKYVVVILKKFDFTTVNTTNTPMEPNKALLKDAEAEDVDVHLYRSMIGLLMYLTTFRPGIMFVVCACSRFQVTPKTLHLYAVKRIFRYLKGQPKLGLWYLKDSPFDLEAFSDTGASLDRKSTTGEYVAAASCCGQVLWIQNQMLDYGFNLINNKIYIDNESTIYIVKTLVFYSKTKHIKIRQHFIRDSYEKKLIQVIKIHTDHNVADLLTKAFDVSRFNFLVTSIGLLNL
nr:hypothetical protein [Tanacetum cinerariifolium]